MWCNSWNLPQGTKCNPVEICFSENDQWDAAERLLQFEEFSGKTGHELSEMILKTLEEHHIDIADCRGQGFDNSSNMSGKVKGVQAEIRKINPLATYSPCASHTLNIFGIHAAESCTNISTFGCLDRSYNSFSASPERWAILKKWLAGPFTACLIPAGAPV